VIRPLDRPVTGDPAARGALAVLTGNLAPRGCVVKPSAASPELLAHTGPALVFENHAEFSARVDDPDLPVTRDSVLVLKNAGPVGAPGFPEWGNLQIPKKLLAQGVRDMVRISDARMSGTHYGTCVLHVAPESALGGPLALVRDGDPVSIDATRRRLDIGVSAAELASRQAEWAAPKPYAERGVLAKYAELVSSASLGAVTDRSLGASRPATRDDSRLRGS
jgi:dihydroxy-acid dehydratase